MRVGRQGDKCQRFKLKGLELVDNDEEVQYLKKLWKFKEDNTPRLELKKATKPTQAQLKANKAAKG